MPEPFNDHPGLLYVVATLLPLAAFTVLLLGGAVRSWLRSQKTPGGLSDTLYELMGGDAAGRGPAWIATGAIMLACVFCVVGLVQFLGEHHEMHEQFAKNDREIRKRETAELNKKDQKDTAKKAATKEPDHEHDQNGGHDRIEPLREENEKLEKDFEERWSGRVTWASLSYRDLGPNQRQRHHVKD